MLDNIIGLVKDQVLNSVTGGNIDIPADKKDQIVDTTASSFMDGLKSNISMDNLSSLTSLFGSKDSTSTNSITSGIQSTVVASLCEKVGLSKELANTIASTAIPAIMGMFQSKANDPNDSSFSIESLIKSFSGGKGGGILGALTGLFGK